jgi:hypothetical protein
VDQAEGRRAGATTLGCTEAARVLGMGIEATELGSSVTALIRLRRSRMALCYRVDDR